MHRLLPGVLLPLLALTAACDPDTLGTRGPFLLDQPEVVGDHIYLLSPMADALIQIDPVTRTSTPVPVGRDPRVLERPPGQDALFTVNRRDETLSRLRPGVSGVPDEIDIDPNFNTLVWSPDGTRAIAFIDPTGSPAPVNNGSLNLNEIALIDALAESPSVSYHTLTYRPLAIDFDSSGALALISTTDRLLVFDAETLSDRAIRFTTDESIRRTPSEVLVSPDDAVALVSVQGVSDLFVIGLDPLLIENVIGLDRSPTDMAVDTAGERLLIADGSRRVTFLDLVRFDVEQLELSHQVHTLTVSQASLEPFALLSGSDAALTRIPLGESDELVPDDPDTWLLQGAVRRIELAPDDSAAVIFHDPIYTSSGTDSLSLFRFDTRGPSHILLDGSAEDLLFIGGELDQQAVVVALSSTDKVVRYNLATYDATVLPTLPAPSRLGLTSQGQMFILHDAEMGLMSFVDPWTDAPPPGGFPALAGFGLGGLLDD